MNFSFYNPLAYHPGSRRYALPKHVNHAMGLRLSLVRKGQGQYKAPLPLFKK